MNKILLIAVIAATLGLVILIGYKLELSPAVALVDGAQAKIAELTSGGLDASTAVSGLSVASAGASITGLISQINKRKAEVSSVINQSQQQIKSVMDQKDQLVNEVTQQKEHLVLEANMLKEETARIQEDAKLKVDEAQLQVTQMKAELDKKQQSIDVLNKVALDLKSQLNEKLIVR